MPDENSNLNLPAAARRPSARRRGRRGGRGRPRAPQPAPENSGAPGESLSAGAPPPGMNEAAAENFPAETENPLLPEALPSAEKTSRPPERPRPERRPEPLRPKVFIKPADYRPAETSAISEAVAHANQIAESMRQMNERLEEILELVELAERQKIADERELDELRRALRRIQPPREPRREEFHGNRREQPPRGEEPRRPRGMREPRENVRPAEESSPPPGADEAVENRDAED